MSQPVALERSVSPLGDGGFLEAMRRFLAIEASAPILALAIRVFARLLCADRATLRLIEGGRPMEAASCGEESPRPGQGIEHEWGLWPLVALGEPVVVSDPVRDARLSPRLREALERVPYRSLLAMPLSREGTVVGVLEAFTRRPQGFSEADRSFAASLAAHASAMLFGPPRRGRSPRRKNRLTPGNEGGGARARGRRLGRRMRGGPSLHDRRSHASRKL